MLGKRNREMVYHPDRRFVGRVDRRLFTNFDWTLLGLVLLLSGIGLVNLYSTTYQSNHFEKFQLQLIWLVVGFLVLSLTFAINYQHFENAAYGILIGVILLLVATLVIGYVSHGAKRWLPLGPLRFQPSELAKIALVIALAKYLAGKPAGKGYVLKDLWTPMGIAAGPIFLVAIQPDLGTAVMLFLIAMTMIIFVGVRLRTVLGLGFMGAGLSVFSYFCLLRSYQQERILTLINPDRDPLGAGYHIRQSLIAIGSGRIFGKGWLEGTQAKLQFLPEAHTDFVFSVLTEEWGFVGGFVILILYFALVAWSINIATRSKNQFGSLLAVGLSALLFWHIFINIGMVLGIMPVVGMPLPFLSYGRTSMLTMMISIGLLLNISSRRYIF